MLLRYCAFKILSCLFFPGVIPVTSSELTAVNFPSFQVTPLKLMVSPTSMAAVPVGNSPALSSSHPLPIQNPSSAIVNFTLQHLGLISPGVQVSTSPGPGTIAVSPRIEAVSVTPENAGAEQGRATKCDASILSQNQTNGQSFAGTGAQQVRACPFTDVFSLVVLKSQISVSWETHFCFRTRKGWEKEMLKGLPSL